VADVVGVGGVDKVGRLLAVDCLVEVSVKEGVLHIKLVDGPGTGDSDAEDSPDGRWLDHRAERLIVVNVVLLREPTNDPTGLVRARVPSEWYLCLKIHFPEMTLAPDGRGTRLQVPLSMRA
jgi:hypothetical protein